MVEPGTAVRQVYDTIMPRECNKKNAPSLTIVGPPDRRGQEWVPVSDMETTPDHDVRDFNRGPGRKRWDKALRFDGQRGSAREIHERAAVSVQHPSIRLQHIWAAADQRYALTDGTPSVSNVLFLFRNDVHSPAGLWFHTVPRDCVHSVDTIPREPPYDVGSTRMRILPGRLPTVSMRSLSTNVEGRGGNLTTSHTNKLFAGYTPPEAPSGTAVRKLVCRLRCGYRAARTGSILMRWRNTCSLQHQQNT